MWKRMLIGIVAQIISARLMDWVLSIADVEHKGNAISVLKNLKAYLATSSSSTTRAMATIIPFGTD